MKLSKLATLVLTLAAAGAVYAQSLTMTANVPFNFVISGQTMSAGKYTINDLGSARTVVIRQADAKASAVAIASNVEQLALADPPEWFSIATATGISFRRSGSRAAIAAHSRQAGSSASFPPDGTIRESPCLSPSADSLFAQSNMHIFPPVNLSNSPSVIAPSAVCDASTWILHLS